MLKQIAISPDFSGVVFGIDPWFDQQWVQHHIGSGDSLLNINGGPEWEIFNQLEAVDFEQPQNGEQLNSRPDIESKLPAHSFTPGQRFLISLLPRSSQDALTPVELANSYNIRKPDGTPRVTRKQFQSMIQVLQKTPNASVFVFDPGADSRTTGRYYFNEMTGKIHKRPLLESENLKSHPFVAVSSPTSILYPTCLTRIQRLVISNLPLNPDNAVTVDALTEKINSTLAEGESVNRTVISSMLQNWAITHGNFFALDGETMRHNKGRYYLDQSTGIVHKCAIRKAATR